MAESAEDWFRRVGCTLVREADRLWPEEGAGNAAFRGNALAEEAGEVIRAITKRRHALNAADGRCKGKTVAEWTEELRIELAQVLGVVMDIAIRENFDLVPQVEAAATALQLRERGT